MSINRKHLGCLVLVLGHGVVSAQPVGGGGIPLMQIPPASLQPREAPTLEVAPEPRAAPATGVDNTRIRVQQIRLTGVKVYPESELLAQTAFQPGTDLTLTDLREMAARLSDFAHRNGYFRALAYLPPQDIKDGVVTMAIVVGQYGKVTIHNETNLRESLADSLISGVDQGDLIEAAPLEERLLLLSDLAGVQVNSTLAPGAQPGTSDLTVNLTPGPRVTGSVDADNAGLPATGAYRLGATVNVNNLAGLGDVASVRVLSSGPGMTYGRASYQVEVGRATVGAAYTQLGYRLGQDFSDLGAHGTAQIASLYASYPLIRSRDTNLYAQLGFDSRIYQDKVDAFDLTTNKTANVLMPGIYGDHRDTLGGGGLTSYGLTLSLGNLDIQTAAVRDIDDSTAKTNGQYGKLAFNAMRIQRVTDEFSLVGSVSGQVASKNLDIWEKMQLGGMYGVRAYPAGTAFGDQGYIVNLEARYLLPPLSANMPGRLSLVALFDTGGVTYNKNAWAPTDNNVTLSGAGVGFTWADPNNFTVKGYYAHKVGGSSDTIASSASGQFWFQLVKYF